MSRIEVAEKATMWNRDSWLGREDQLVIKDRIAGQAKMSKIAKVEIQLNGRLPVWLTIAAKVP